MSRASSVWLIRNSDRDVLGAFTVRHEMVSHLEMWAEDLSNLEVVRIPDGRPALAHEHTSAKEALGWA